MPSDHPSYFTDEETEALRSEMSCPTSEKKEQILFRALSIYLPTVHRWGTVVNKLSKVRARARTAHLTPIWFTIL